MILWFQVFFHSGCAHPVSRVWQWDENTKVSNALGGRSGHWEMFEDTKLFEPVLEVCMTVFSPGSTSSLNRARGVGENEQGWASQIWKLKYLSGRIFFSTVCSKHLFRSALIHTDRCFKTCCAVHQLWWHKVLMWFSGYFPAYQIVCVITSSHPLLMTHMITLPAQSVVQRKFCILLVQCSKGMLVAVPQENRNAHMGAPVLTVPEPPFSHMY